MKIIYLITKIITYPGAYLKGFFEHLTCRALGLPVRSNRYLRSTLWCGHAEHLPAASPVQAFMLCFLPFMLQFLLGSIFLGSSFGPLLIFGLRSPAETSFFWLEVVSLFLGFSLVCNAFPQWSDAKRLWHLFYGKPNEEELALMEAETKEALAAIERLEEEAAQAAAIEAQETAILAGESLSEDKLVDEANEPIEETPAEEFAAEEETIAEELIAEDFAGDDAAGEEFTGKTFTAPIFALTPAPKFAGLFAKIVLAPCNLFFMAGAFMEYTGLSTILALGITIAALILN